MFNLTVSFGEKQWQFLFNNFERADAVLKQYEEFASKNTLISIFDDFGNTALLDAASITGMLIENYLKSVDAAIERHMVQARGQAKAQSKIANDPLLRMVGPMNGPMPHPGMMRS
jgi:hypothetical protein